jgi:hypothetical protein
MQAAYGTSLRAEPGVSSGARTDKIASVGRALALEDDRFAGVAAQTAGGHAGRRPEFALWVAAAVAERAGLRGRMR